MDKLTKQFFGDAKKLHLTSREKAVLWDQIATIASSKNISLSTLEKAECFSRIVQHMRSNPIGSTENHGLSAFWRFHKLLASTMIAVLILGTGGGTAAYAAQAAIPGDKLYSLKVDVTEPLIDMAVSIDPEWAAEWERRRIKRRLKEAEHLTAQHGLTEDHRVLIENRVARRMERLQERLDQMPEDQRIQMQARVDDVIERHERFLDDVAEATSFIPEEVQVLKEHVGKMRDQAHERWNPVYGDGDTDGDDLIPLAIRKRKEILGIPPAENLPPSGMQNGNPSVESNSEGWLSGRKRTTRNRVDPQGSRGFESPSLRQQELPVFSPERREELMERDLPNIGEKMRNTPLRSTNFFPNTMKMKQKNHEVPPEATEQNVPHPMMELSL